MSEMYWSLEYRSSTHIMIDNIIDGLVENQYEILFLAISISTEQKVIREIYQKRGIKVLFWESRISRKIKNKYQYLSVMYKEVLKGTHMTQELLEEILNFADKDTVILSHSPSIESVLLCRQIKKRKNLHYIQYWSDPIALSGILPEKFGIKRIPFWIIENQALAFADEIVYGTKILMTFQKRLFKKQKNKMRYVRVSYIQKNNTIAENVSEGFRLIYSGNYYRRIRDIVPLYEAMKQLSPEYHLSIYGSGDIILQDTFNVKVYGRIDSEHIQDQEKKAQIQICILNKECIQIPGKIFYNTDLNQRILVLLDGRYRELIRQELEEYHRFEFCENNANVIAEYLREHISDFPVFDKQSLDLLSPSKMADCIIHKHQEER